MLVKEKLGNISELNIGEIELDHVIIEWYETNKRILNKRSVQGKDITIRFLKENQDLKEGDIIYKDASEIITIEIKPCDSIIISPKDMNEMAGLCYEIGNKHLPLFIEEYYLMIPFDQTLYKQFDLAGYNVERGDRKLANALRTSVAAHSNGSGSTLFSMMMKFKKGE